MKKNDVFTFTAPNGVEVTAVVLKVITMSECERTESSETWTTIYLCYAQNRIFLHNVWKRVERVINDDCPDDDNVDYYYALKYYSHDVETTGYHQEIIVDFAILPDYDEVLGAAQQKFDDDCYEALSSIGDMNF